MVDYKFSEDMNLHNFVIQIFILFLIVVIYFSLKVNKKVIENPMSMPICLLGSYIGLNAGLTLLHNKLMK